MKLDLDAIGGAFLLLMIWIVLLGLADLATAGDVNFVIKPGEKFSVECKATTTPPPSRCPGADIPINTIRMLEIGPKRRIALFTGRANVYKFKGRDLQTGVVFIAGEHAPGAPTPSPGTAVSISRCPANWDYRVVGIKCVTQGRETALRIGSNACKVDPAKEYYVNVSAMTSQSQRPTCKQPSCGIVMQASRGNP